MPFVTGLLATVVALQAAGLVALLIRGARRAREERTLRASEERLRAIADPGPPRRTVDSTT
jgi:hypothetical protein